jgi:hypothetical protein
MGLDLLSRRRKQMLGIRFRMQEKPIPPKRDRGVLGEGPFHVLGKGRHKRGLMGKRSVIQVCLGLSYFIK